MEAEPVQIAVDQSSPRLEYVLDILFRQILETDYILTQGQGDLYYTQKPQAKTWIQASSLLYESDIRSDLQMPHYLEELPDPASFDWFAWIFYRLSHYAAYLPEAKPTGKGPGKIQVEDLAFSIADWLKIPLPDPSWDYEITIDIDNPWKHRHKAWWIQAGGFAKDLIKGKGSGLAERWRSIFQKQDPYDTDQKIQALCPPEKTTLFILVDGDDPRDSRYSFRQKPFAQKIKAFKELGYSIGLHPSYQSQLNPQIIREEMALLRGTVGPVHKSRQHYLRYQMPQTFQYLKAEGVTQEYSLCPKNFTGPLTGISRPYPWYDLSQERQTELTQVPAVLMDRSLQQYLKLQPAEALQELRQQIRKVRQRKGKFVLILHNETFSGNGEWQGWDQVLAELLPELEAHGS